MAFWNNKIFRVDIWLFLCFWNLANAAHTGGVWGLLCSMVAVMMFNHYLEARNG